MLAPTDNVDFGPLDATDVAYASSAGNALASASSSSAPAAAYAQVRQGGISLSHLKRQIERDCIARALAETRGNITNAAAILGLKRPRLSQLVKQYGLTAISSDESH